MIPNRTESALMARGVDSQTAKRLRTNGWTLVSLMCADDSQLSALGLDENTKKCLRKGRPTIPSKNLIAVLFSNRFLCCVCRESSKPIVVHHIAPWAESRDHSVANLAVLCTEHHGEAHSTHALEVTLTSSLLKKEKKKWEAAVTKLDPIAIQKSSQIHSDQWLYFNHLRIFDFAFDNEIELTKIPGFVQAHALGVVDSAGNVTKRPDTDSFMYCDSDGRILYRYVKGVLSAVIELATARNVSDHLDRSVLNATIVTNDIIYVQGLHRFKTLDSTSPHGSQLVEGSRSANSVKVKFVFDRAEATSVSAWSVWLCGQNNVGSLLQVKRIERDEQRKLIITGTVLGIRTSADGAKERMYELSLFKSGIPQRKELEHEEDGDFEEIELDFLD